MTGTIILGHGSRAKEANAALEVMKEMVKGQLQVDNVETAYLQFCQPDLKEAVAKMASRGVTKIVIMPFFLYRGTHILEDVPGELAKLTQKYQGKVELIFARHLGPDPRIADIVVDRIREVS